MTDSVVSGDFCFGDPGLIADGQRVEQSTINPIIQQLYENDQRLKAVQDYFEMPSALLACVDTDGLPDIGQPVYYNPITSLYELSQYATTTIGNRIYLLPKANIWGLVVEKISATRARILIDGIYPVDLTNSLGTSAVDHAFYLSDTVGEFSQYPPDDVAPVFAGVGSGDGKVLFRPWMQDFSALILQWRHDLSTEVAGDAVVVDGNVSIQNADSGQIGWLPANDASFGGTAPVGALFGYNIAADADLAALWPPRFLNTVHVEYHAGGGPDGAVSLTTGVAGTVTVDENGIWWNSDCVADSPFLTDVPSYLPTDCPRPTAKRVTITAAKPAGPSAGDLQAEGVRSITSIDSFLRVRKKGDSITASRGDLDLDVYWSAAFSVDSTSESGLAVKGSLGNKLQRGPVVARLKPGAGISLSGASGDNTDGYYGTVTASLASASSAELLPLSTALTGATEENTFGLLSLGLPAGRSSKITSTFQVPAYLASTVTLRLKSWFAARYDIAGSGSAAAEPVAISYKVITPPSAPLNIAGLSSTGLTNLSVPVSHGVMNEVSSDTFDVAAGSVVSVTLERTGESMAYSLLMLKQFLQVVG